MSFLYVSGDSDKAKDAGLDEIAAAAAKQLGLCGAAQAEVLFVTEQEIRDVNAQTRGVNNSTDVLSFPALALSAGEYPPFTAANFPTDADPDTGRVDIGSILICEAVARRQAEEYGHGAEREIGYLFLHGLLHLLGYDHIEERDKEKMRAAEENILGAVGLSRGE